MHIVHHVRQENSRRTSLELWDRKRVDTEDNGKLSLMDFLDAAMLGDSRKYSMRGEVWTKQN